ncbi:S1 family peptidase [Nocardia sp. NPDC051570]|uniref:S1 family peptidase n=1 Tax=Nocardia sp. NPDC051570 TaxID=3364324 RepID=UPI0037990201
MSTVRAVGAMAAIITSILLGGAGAVTGQAHAASPAVVGGGSGIALATADPATRALCTLTTIGYDHANRLVGITAGHCGETGAEVWAENSRGTGVIGHVAVRDRQHDWETIEFDPAQVIAVRRVGETEINGIGAVPAPGDTVCKNGRTTGFTCGIVLDSDTRQFVNYACATHGDSGGPVLLGDRLVGMINGAAYAASGHLNCLDPAIPLHSPALSNQITTILAEIDAITEFDAVGAGFRPL